MLMIRPLTGLINLIKPLRTATTMHLSVAPDLCRLNGSNRYVSVQYYALTDQTYNKVLV